MDIQEVGIDKSREPAKKNARRQAVLKKLDLDSAKLLQTIRDKVNKKAHGRNIRDAEILAVALELVGPEQIRELQEATYSESDRLNMVHEEYQRQHGRLSLDQFIGKLLRGEVERT